MKRITTLIFTLLLCADAFAATAEKPSIVIILADDLEYSDFGCYGEEIDTPNIDRLAGNGIRFSSY